MRRIHYPILLRNVEEAKAATFVKIFTLEAICRALLATIVPLLAYKYLQDAQKVSLLYLVLNGIGLAVGLGMPLLLQVLARRWVITLGCCLYIMAGIALTQAGLTGLIIGLSGQVLGTALLELTVNLYLMDHIPRRELNSFEPKRLLFAGMCFAMGPWLGVWLHHNLDERLPFYIVSFAALVLGIYFWKQRLGSHDAIKPAVGRPKNPFRFLRRYLAQPRLVLAWVLAAGRNGWWVMFFVYTPIFVSESGLDPEIGGALVSLGVAPMLFVRYWGRLGARFGIRKLLIASYIGCGVFTISAGVMGAQPWVAIILLWTSALAATVIDGAGNVPFLRAVHPHERSEMTPIFMTFRYATSLLTPALFAIVLAFLPLNFVFVAGGCVAVGMGLLSTYLPRRL